MRLKRIRQTIATVCIVALTLLFLDFTGTLHACLGWMAEIQFFPALLALNVGVFVALVLLTLIFGRVYCSIICPLGVLQDLFAHVASKRKRNRYAFSPERKRLRTGILIVFIIASLFGLGGLIEPYSAYGRIVSNLFAPVYHCGTNLLAYLAERADSYAFYSVDVQIKGVTVLIISLLTLIIIGWLAWRGGRIYCNTFCPVGTILSYLARFSYLKPIIDTQRCISCHRCERNCKSSCIQIEDKHIDYGRCVACMNCIDVCPKHAVNYIHPVGKQMASETHNQGRRNFATLLSFLTVGTWLKAQEKIVDGGLAVIEDKKTPERKTPLKPPGAQSLKSFTAHCTACQLCVSSCKNNVLFPSTKLTTWMQPEMRFEEGYCRPECTECSKVCPTGAIKPISVPDKASTQIGHAVTVYDNCLVNTDSIECDNCARHCPTGAILMTDVNRQGHKLPVVNIERCIGCGACEYLCPARPFSAIYIEGHQQHRLI